MPDQNTPNRQSNQEPAEGSRETVTEQFEQDHGEDPGALHDARPADEERRPDPVLPSTEPTLNTKI